MIKAILLDLDNTLIKNPDREFATRFVEVMDRYFLQTCGTDGASKAFRAGLETIRQTNVAMRFIRDAIALAFTEQFNLEFDKARDVLSEFYATAFDELEDCITPVPDATGLINDLFALDMPVVLATNPLYEEVGIMKRLAWGDIDTETAFAFRTSADTVHFIKPDKAYYAEIIARLGVEPDEVVLVGDSVRNDIMPAYEMGMHSYHITDETPHEIASTGGTLSQFRQLVADGGLTQFRVKRLDKSMIEAQYRGNLAAMRGLLREVSHDLWHRRPDVDEWSIAQICCHLVDSERDVQRKRLEMILANDTPFIIAPPPPGPNIDVCDDDVWHIIAQWEHERQKTLDLIAGFSDEDWERGARHSIFGWTTLLEMAHFTAQHDRLHLNQVCQVIGRCSD